MSNFRRRLMMNFEKKYTPVEYLESTGTQYIDTLKKISINSQIISKFLFVGNKNNNMTAFGYRYDRDGKVVDALAIIPLIYSSKIYVSYGSAIDKTYTIDSTFNIASEYICNKLGLWVNGIQKVSYTNVDVDTNIPSIYLFARNNNGSADRYSSIRMYSFQIYDNNNLVCDFIPVLDKDGVPCLYDKVEDKFYYNEGSGEFLYE